MTAGYISPLLLLIKQMQLNCLQWINAAALSGEIAVFLVELSRLTLLYFLLLSAVEFKVMVTSFGVEPLSKEAFRGRITGESSVAAKTVRLIRAGGRKGQLEIIWRRSFFFDCFHSCLVWSFVDLRWEQRRIPSDDSFIWHCERTSAPRPPTTLIKLMQLIPPAAAAVAVVLVPEPCGFTIQRGPQMCDADRRTSFFFFRVLFFRRICGLEREAPGPRWGSWDAHRQTLRQPVCKGMLVPAPISLHIPRLLLHSTSDLKCGWWTFV